MSEASDRLLAEWTPEKVRIWKLHRNGDPRTWYCWDWNGYTYDLAEAGVYDRAEAEKHIRGCTSEFAVNAIGVVQVDPDRHAVDGLASQVRAIREYVRKRADEAVAMRDGYTDKNPGASRDYGIEASVLSDLFSDLGHLKG